ncbi:MAG: pyridoxine 5'-phosphate synthase [Verrucomicrobiota bacterium]|nr:pyridoxine 5'-phosphate synthase [Verrucomicrobiota bacterium]
MILLGVNVDHVATLRQARYRDESTTHGGFVEPDPAALAWLAEDAGADGITMHVREDRRHVQVEDVRRSLERKRTRLNLEVSLAPEMVELALELKPESVCLVPENRKEVTTEGGLDVVGNLSRSREAVRAFIDAGIPTSMFIDPDPAQLEASAEIGSPWVELHTGSFARAWYRPDERDRELAILRKGMEVGVSLGLRVNAGHGINYDNVEGAKTLKEVYEYNIGHSIIARSLTHGLAEAVQTMRRMLNE